MPSLTSSSSSTTPYLDKIRNYCLINMHSYIGTDRRPDGQTDIHAHTHTKTCTCVRLLPAHDTITCAYVHLSLHAQAYTHTHVQLRTHLDPLHVHTHIHMHMRTCTHIQICMGRLASGQTHRRAETQNT